MHYGLVCNSGTTCTSGRTLADYFDVGDDQNGMIRLVFDDESSQYRQAHLMEARQLSPAEPKSPMDDPAGDAQMPHYSPTGPGPNSRRSTSRTSRLAADEGRAARADDARGPRVARAAARQDLARVADAVPGEVGDAERGRRTGSSTSARGRRKAAR